MMYRCLSLLAAHIGKIIYDVGVNKLAVVVSPNERSVVLGSSVLASFYLLTPSKTYITRIEHLEELVSFDPHLTFFPYPEFTAVELTSSLSSLGIATDVLFWGSNPGNMLNTNDRDVYFITMKNNSLLLNKAGKEMTPIFEYSVSADLLGCREVI